MNLAFAILFLSSSFAAAPNNASLDLFALDGTQNLVGEEQFGIVNEMATVGVNHQRMGSIGGLWSPPYTASTLLVEPRVNGKPIPVAGYTWRPFSVSESGTVEKISFACTISLVEKTRGGIISLAATNSSNESKSFPLELFISGGLERTTVWEFGRPETKNTGLEQDGLALLVRCDTDMPADIHLSPGETRVVNAAFSAGPKEEADSACSRMLGEPKTVLSATEEAWERRAEELFERLPRLESDNASLVRWYNRSLVHLLMNRWELPDFVLHPYYSTGSVKGGCVCDYLWNFGEVWEILPLYDPAAARAHILQFLRGDITQHFAFNPVTGGAFGPWYPVNQEKIIGLIYYYVKNTGDTGFLGEYVADETVLDWAVLNALHGDDVEKPVALIDYGASNSHLELRKGLPYNHVMPDLNGRRYVNYTRVAALCDAAGRPMPLLNERATALQSLLKKALWNADIRWFQFQNEQGAPDVRYTVQMFKLFNSPVLDSEEEKGLLSHLNEREFLSEYGLHSMSKLDPAYDQVDIDNGGGGICTGFVPQIMEKLYLSRHADVADDIFKRVLWWGDRLPYWGDSIVANAMDYRRDTPLQCTIDGVAGAQTLIFGLMGVEAGFDGTITVSPKHTTLGAIMALKGLHLRGKTLDINVSGGHFQVTDGGAMHESQMGTPVVIR